ncbi:MAG: DUF4388 domain-containing protein [Xenococcaceae cyanobacterium]
MSISTSLELFSLADLFRLIEFERKSGRLTIQVSLEDQKASLKKIYYIWFKDGYLVAVSDRLNHRGLISIIETRGWLSPSVTNQLRTLCPLEVPLGTYLKQAKLLTSEQINLIFQIQLHQVFQLFELNSSSFRFDEMSELKDRIMTIPWLEMTGNRLPATGVSMYALRLIKNWDVFAEQLPASHLIFKRVLPQSRLKLMSLEQQLWQKIDGLNSLNTIARQVNKPIESIQIAAFRLMAVGLIEEIILPSLTLETIQLNSASENLRELKVFNTKIDSETKEQVQQNNRNENQDSQTKPDFQTAKEISIANFYSSQRPHQKRVSKASQSNSAAPTSLLDNLIGLLRSQF